MDNNIETIEAFDSYVTDSISPRLRRVSSDIQDFDSDIIESVERQCEVAITELRDNKKQTRTVEAKLKDVGLCNNMIDEYLDYVGDIDYEVGFIKNNLSSYRKDMISAEEGGISFFTNLDVSIFSNSVINTPVIQDTIEVQVDNIPSLVDPIPIGINVSSQVVEQQEVAPEVEKVELFQILPEGNNFWTS